MVLPLVQRIADLAARDGKLEPETEQIRAELHASRCLTAEAHKRFHDALPPLR
jgi:outer membrane murein-binding lipoprotein Lpp